MENETPTLPEKWRTGESGRTIYRMVDEEPSSDDWLIGMMDDPELASLVVDALNDTGAEDETILLRVHQELLETQSEAHEREMLAAVEIGAEVGAAKEAKIAELREELAAARAENARLAKALHERQPSQALDPGNPRPFERVGAAVAEARRNGKGFADVYVNDLEQLVGELADTRDWAALWRQAAHRLRSDSSDTGIEELKAAAGALIDSLGRPAPATFLAVRRLEILLA